MNEYWGPAWLKRWQSKEFTNLENPYITGFSWTNYHHWALTPSPVEYSGNVYDFSAYGDEALIVQNEQQTLVQQLPTSLMEAGVIFCPLTEALWEVEALEQYLTQDEATQLQAAIHQAHFQEGLFVYIPAACQLKEVLHWQILQEVGSQMNHLCLVLGAGAQASFAEEFCYESVVYSNQAVQVFLQEGASLHYQSQSLGKAGEQSYMQRHFHLGRQAKLNYNGVLLNGGEHVEDVHLYLAEEGAQCEVRLQAYSGPKENKALHLQVEQAAPHTRSFVHLKGLSAEKGKVYLNADSHITKTAPYSEAKQKSELLLAGEKAGGSADPILRIDHNEVKANHAASMGQVPEEALYYMMSRGLTKEIALHLYAQGFLGTEIGTDAWQKVWKRKQQC